MTNPVAAVRSWLAARWARLTLAARFAPMTARAGAAVLRVIVIERLWQVPVRVRPNIAAGRAGGLAAGGAGGLAAGGAGGFASLPGSR